MATSNPITGDLIKSKSPSQAYSDGYDRIFGNKKKQEPQPNLEDKTCKQQKQKP